MNSLIRRGFKLGSAPDKPSCAKPQITERWANGYPVLLEEIAKPSIEHHQQAILATEKLVLSVLEGNECLPLLNSPHYKARLTANFTALGCAINEGDDQEIETVLFDAVTNGEVVAEDLWMKLSWLSFAEEDASLRFRFSFGVDHEEDVAADSTRQRYAAQLTNAIFPESAIITENQSLKTTLTELLNCDNIHYVERIVYFNAPSGGAYLHHDLERGHAGVAFAQLSGSTYWLALPKNALILEIVNFVNADVWPESVGQKAREEIRTLANNPKNLAEELDSFANSSLIHLINETETFVQQLVRNGHGQELVAGDILLLPQQDQDTCCWHSVFCLGEEMGQALSFAIRCADDEETA